MPSVIRTVRVTIPVNEPSRRVACTVVSAPVPFEHHSAAVQLLPDGAGGTVRFGTTDFLPASLEPQVSSTRGCSPSPTRGGSDMTLKQWFVAANTTRNVGQWDRVVRALLPVAIFALWTVDVLPTWAAVPLGVFTLIFVPTSFTGACSIYYLLGWSTCPVSAGSAGRTATT